VHLLRLCAALLLAVYNPSPQDQVSPKALGNFVRSPSCGCGASGRSEVALPPSSFLLPAACRLPIRDKRCVCYPLVAAPLPDAIHNWTLDIKGQVGGSQEKKSDCHHYHSGCHHWTKSGYHLVQELSPLSIIAL
jgi:hypothetical protein